MAVTTNFGITKPTVGADAGLWGGLLNSALDALDTELWDIDNASVKTDQLTLDGATSGGTVLRANAVASGTLTLPAATDTLVGRATTDTFTNKTFDTGGAGNVFRIAGTQVTAVSGSGPVVLATSPTLTTPNIGTPSAGNLGNCSGLPVATGLTGLGANVASFLSTPSSAALAAAVTDETGSGSLVFGTGPTLGSPTLVTPNLGTPSAGNLTNCTGLPAATGLSGLGTNVASFLATPSSANLAAAVSDETGSGSLVFATGPTLSSPVVNGTLTAGGGVGSSGQVLQSTGSGVQWASVATPSNVMAILTKTANYTVLAGDGDDVLVRVDASSGPVTITLYSAAIAGKRVVIKKVDNSSNAVTISASASQTVDGAASRTIGSQYHALALVSGGGTNWEII